MDSSEDSERELSQAQRNYGKEQALYGVFAGDIGFMQQKEFRKGKQRNYSKPLAFVSGGSTTNKEEGEKNESNGVDEGPSSTSVTTAREPMVVEKPGIGMAGGFAALQGFGAKEGDAVPEPIIERRSGGGEALASSSSAAKGASTSSMSSSRPSFSMSSAVPTQFGQMLPQAQFGASGKRKERKRSGKDDYSGYGVGSKLLAKMGFTGGGLGKEGREGISKPIEVKVRPTGMGLGFGGFQEMTSQVKQELAKAEGGGEQGTAGEMELDELSIPQRERDGWKKEKRAARRKQRTEYVIPKGEATTTLPATIIDFRGPQTQVITDAKVLSDRAEAEKKYGHMPELHHNLRLLVDVTVVELQNTESKRVYELERIARLRRECDRLSAELAAESDTQKRHEQVLNLLKEFKKRAVARTVNLDDAVVLFEQLAEKFPREYKVFRLGHIAVELVFPLLRARLHSWPSKGFLSGELETESDEKDEEDQKLVDNLRRWRKLLLSRHRKRETRNNELVEEELVVASRTRRDDAEVYRRLLDECVLPRFRAVLVSHWKPRHSGPAIRLFESMNGIVSRNSLSTLVDQLILPKLTYEVESWDPRTDPVPLHEWLEPWIPLIGNRAETLFGPIRHKLAKLLNLWHPSDASGRHLLDAWARVFNEESTVSLVNRSILPKLQDALAEVDINPAQQELDVFIACIEWANFEKMQPAPFVEVLEKTFFPHWWRALRTWLWSDSVKFDEVAEWYSSWKELFPVRLVQNSPRIRVLFNHALDLMRARLLNLAPPAMPPFMHAADLEASDARLAEAVKRSKAATAANVAANVADAADAAGMRLEDLLGEIAGENGIIFMPIDKYHDGKRIFKFGSASIYLDKGLIVIRDSNRWIPITLEALLERETAL